MSWKLSVFIQLLLFSFGQGCFSLALAKGHKLNEKTSAESKCALGIENLYLQNEMQVVIDAIRSGAEKKLYQIVANNSQRTQYQLQVRMKYTDIKGNDLTSVIHEIKEGDTPPVLGYVYFYGIFRSQEGSQNFFSAQSSLMTMNGLYKSLIETNLFQTTSGQDQVTLELRFLVDKMMKALPACSQ